MIDDVVYIIPFRSVNKLTRYYELQLNPKNNSETPQTPTPKSPKSPKESIAMAPIQADTSREIKTGFGRETVLQHLNYKFIEADEIMEKLRYQISAQYIHLHLTRQFGTCGPIILSLNANEKDLLNGGNKEEGWRVILSWFDLFWLDSVIFEHYGIKPNPALSMENQSIYLID